ncbi:hypothetical protein FB45DRAFT_1067615 [Roridomyces roridus]|uniref:MYND-type domain-containing protein n=1 Tax=Roridomyces roridus TaxID=1738132 RepID=A0AAD7FA68_9AGAR|nr:hypothetical protein FB45DRAFT_1067615 [Roridomyces roridus]
MHECLQPRALSKLPGPIKKLVASTVLTGSADGVKLLFERTPKESLVLLLPVIYKMLDPADIPTSRNPDKSFPTACTVPFFAMGTIPRISGMPKEVGFDLWPRLWAWFLFIESDCQTRDDRETEWLACTRIIHCALLFRYLRHTETNTLLQTTPRLFSAVTRAWQSASLQWHESDGTEGSGWAIAELAVAITLLATDPPPWKSTSPRMLQDLVDGADGSPAVFASVLMQHIHIAYLGTGNGAGWLHLGHLIPFLESFLETADHPNADLACQILQELVDQDLIPSLLRAVHTAAIIPVTQHSDQIAGQCLRLLTKLLVSKQICGTAVRASIIAGLLRSTLLCGQKSYLATSHNRLKTVLVDILPPFTLYRQVLRPIRGILRRGEPYTITTAFAASGLLASWTHFAGVAKERLAVLDAFESGEILHIKSCDNILCNKQAPKTDFMCCSGCQNSYYCARDCQETDWKDGGHREACSKNRTPILNETMSPTNRERSFIRAIVHRHYVNAKSQIFRDTVKCLQKHPGAGYFVEFDYIVMAHVRITVRSLSTNSTVLEQLSRHPQWHQMLARTARSDGRMTIHVVQMVAGDKTGSLLIPLRSSSGIVAKGLERIARELPSAGSEELEEAIQNLVVRSADEVEEIH